MRFNKNKISNNGGFTLTEVMIGMMILTIAIVSATNLLVSLRKSNDNNVKTLQAYYFAEEGIEAARNIRDTNWIYNIHWLGDNPVQGIPWMRKFEKGQSYGISLNEPDKYWNIVDSEVVLNFVGDNEKSVFTRSVSFDEYECGITYVDGSPDCDDFVLVTSNVKWNTGSKDRNVDLQAVLTDWKGGAL